MRRQTTDNPEAYMPTACLAYSLKTANTSTNALGAQKYLKKRCDWTRIRPCLGAAVVRGSAWLSQQFLQPTVALR